MNNEQIIFNEILRAGSVDTKYKPMEEVDNTDLNILAIIVVLMIIGVIIF